MSKNQKEVDPTLGQMLWIEIIGLLTSGNERWPGSSRDIRSVYCVQLARVHILVPFLTTFEISDKLRIPCVPQLCHLYNGQSTAPTS